MEKMVVDLNRLGRKNGKGFYDYEEDGSKRLWTGLADLVPVRIAQPSASLVEEVRTRLLFRQAVEAAKCIDEGVITDPRSADVGALLGWGFAGWTGGPIGLIDMVGLEAFVERCDQLAAKCGSRFEPPPLLRKMAQEGSSFYPRPAQSRAA